MHNELMKPQRSYFFGMPMILISKNTCKSFALCLRFKIVRKEFSLNNVYVEG